MMNPTIRVAKSGVIFIEDRNSLFAIWITAYYPRELYSIFYEPTGERVTPKSFLSVKEARNYWMNNIVSAE